MIANIQKKWFTFQTPLVWRNIIGIFLMHVCTLYTIICLFPEGKPISFIFGIIYGYFGGLSITVGAHRLWTHRAYKAKLPLRIILMIGFVASGMYPLVQWARDHRLHHKFSDTEADPHNANRGFFYSHCGWLMMKRTEESKEKGKLIDVSDLWADPVIAFQQKYFVPLLVFFHFIFPVVIVGHYLIGDPLFGCIMAYFAFRYCVILNITWSINSVSHFYGYKPYNKDIRAVQNKTAAFFTFGEGWHNFHHVFPWDYRIGEYGQEYQLGAWVIDLFAKIGWAYDLKSPSPEMIQKVLMKANKIKQTSEIVETEKKSVSDILSKSANEEDPVTNSCTKRNNYQNNSNMYSR